MGSGSEPWPYRCRKGVSIQGTARAKADMLSLGMKRKMGRKAAGPAYTGSYTNPSKEGGSGSALTEGSGIPNPLSSDTGDKSHITGRVQSWSCHHGQRALKGLHSILKAQAPPGQLPDLQNPPRSQVPSDRRAFAQVIPAAGNIPSRLSLNYQLST